jgi:hypothetical protein
LNPGAPEGLNDTPISIALQVTDRRDNNINNFHSVGVQYLHVNPYLEIGILIENAVVKIKRNPTADFYLMYNKL